MSRAGTFDRRVHIQRETLVPNEYGEEISSWAAVASVWARLEVYKGDEGFVAPADQRSAEQHTFFNIRYRDGVTPRMRLLHSTQVYEIIDVATVGRKDELQLKCKIFEARPAKG